MWFASTDEFINTLPDRYKNEIMNEYKSIESKFNADSSKTMNSKPIQSNNHNYFKICRSNLQILNDYIVAL
jgi:hypothetical protein